MKMTNADRITKIFIVFGLLIFCAETFGQAVCLTVEQAQKAVNTLDAPQNAAENKSLRLELLSMRDAREKLEQKIIENSVENQKMIPLATEMGEKHLLRLCEIVRQNGWVSKKTVGDDGVAAALLIAKANRAFNLQRQIFPVIAAAAKKGLIGNQEVAWMIDSIRLEAGLPQIFGTQTNLKNELFYLYPLQNEAKVDEYRKLYNLPPLRDYIKFLQSRYQTVVLKSAAAPPTVSPASANQQISSDASVAVADPLVQTGENEVIKVESSLVSLNVRVQSDAAKTAEIPLLQKNDFEVYEDGKKQEISFFSASDAPFDLILLLDLSGSTADKQDLIRKSTRRFVEAARPSDRIAIVTFTDEAKIISNLTQNREELLRSIKKIDDRGGSGIWGSLQFVYDQIIKTQSDNRRTAVLLMTDGVDSSFLQNSFLPASYPTFTETLETVRKNDTTVFPIYLDTTAQSNSYEKKSYRTAQQTLKMIADESGGQVHYAKKVNDLNGIYEKIINDLGKVYSLGYEPANSGASGSFHQLTVNLPKHPNLSVRAKKGYYAK